MTFPCTFPLAEALGLKVANGFVLLDAIKVVRRLVLDCHVAGSAGGAKHCIFPPSTAKSLPENLQLQLGNPT